MAKKPQTDKPASAATGPDLDQVTNASQKSMLAFGHLNSRLLRNALEVNAQLLDFARNRIGEDIRTSEQLACCANVTDTVAVISGFYQKAFAEYAEEANQLVKLGSDAATQALEDIQRGTIEVSESAADK
jgi:hypothetical protein